MQIEKKVDFVKWFSELDKNSGAVAGGKGANLAEIYNMKVPVPPGFVVTAQAYDYFIEKAGIKEKIKMLLSEINYEDTKQLDEITKIIRELITTSKLPKEIEEEILESYESLGASEIQDEMGYATRILKNSSEPIFVAVRSSATAEDLEGASFAGQQETFVNVKGNSDLLTSVRKCFASLFTARAVYYRNKKGFAHEKVSLAVVVQKMIDSDKSGVVFSKSPTGKNENIIIEAVWGLGEGIVSGQITPDKYEVTKDLEIADKKISNKKIAITRDSSGGKMTVKLKEERAKSPVLTNYEIRKLAEIAMQLEEHYLKPQDIEFSIQDEGIYIVQTRPITTLGKEIEIEKDVEGEVILSGLAASPGIASGKIKIINEMSDLEKIKFGDILVTEMTNPDMVVAMQKSAAIVTDEGGLTSHAAIISREMGIPAVVGTYEATQKLKEGEIITVDGFTGKIYKGKVSETRQKEILPVTASTKTEIKVIVDLPTFAKRASQTGLKKVGLTRIEGIIAESGKHPEYFLKNHKIKEYEDIIYEGIKGISKYFEEIWIRTSDIRTDEFNHLEGAPEQIEANPMLGLHGIRYSLKNPEILKAELNALKRNSHSDKKFGILIPQLISVDELRKTKEIIRELNFHDLKIGIMVETPAAVQMIRELCEEGIDFISFGTNDLTQFILAVDRGNKKVQDLYDEMNPAVLHQLEFVIRVCKRNKVMTSICGQSGSKKEMVKFLVEKGIDSISVNADVAKEISDYVAELEKESGEQPRQYQPEKEIIPQEENEIEQEIEEENSEENEEPILEPTYTNPDEEIEKEKEEEEEIVKELSEEIKSENKDFEEISEDNDEIEKEIENSDDDDEVLNIF